MVDRYIGIVEAADSISAWSTVFYVLVKERMLCFNLGFCNLLFQNKTKNKFKIRYGRTRPDALPISS